MNYARQLNVTRQLLRLDAMKGRIEKYRAKFPGSIHVLKRLAAWETAIHRHETELVNSIVEPYSSYD